MRNPNQKSKKNSFAKIVMVFLSLLVVTGAVGGWFYVDSLAYKVCRVEAGIEVAPSDFLTKPDATAIFAEGSQKIDITQPGEYFVKVKSGWFTHNCTLIIEDTIAPVGEAAAVEVEIGSTCAAEKLVKNIVDATAVEVFYEEEPDFTKPGRQTIPVVLVDRGNNRAVVETEILISPVVKELTVEAGSNAPTVESFLIADCDATLLTAVRELDYTRVADYQIEIQAEGEIYPSVLHVTDTVPPVVSVHALEGFALVPKTAVDFVTAIEDVTEVSASFEKEPDWTVVGEQTAELLFTDGGGNETRMSALLILKEDTEAPVITGAIDKKVFIGDGISYKKGVTVTDNCGEEIVLNIDSSSVNLNVEGVYPVTYTATDPAGNTAAITVNITVSARKYDEETVNALADAVLAKIIKPEMTGMEKVRAIYDYTISNIGYISHSEKGDWVQAAYEGLKEKQGDCYVYACTAKILLTRAGITNMDIEKIPSKTRHYWNLVDLGDGWYHFDTTPRKDHPTIFMWTDEELMNYSAQHGKSHNYDHSQYPEVN